MLRDFRVGDRVELVADCPIDFEGVGPIPGDQGRVATLTDASPEPGSVRVEFSRIASRWLISRKHLRFADHGGEEHAGILDL